MVRRTFLAAGLAAPFPAARARGRAVRIGFLGASHSHGDGKIRVAAGSPEYDIAGLWDNDPAVRARYEKQGLSIVQPEEQLKDQAIEVIAVEGPVPDHARDGLRVVEAGKHLHLEKPPAQDVESLREILNVAASRGLVVQQGYMWRYHPGINRMLEAAREGWLGDIHLVQAAMHKTLAEDARVDWAQFRGGQMFELGPHVIDPLVRLLGRPNRVTPYLKKHGEFDDTLADNTIAVFEYSGALGLVTGAALAANGSRYRSFEIHGTNGVATLRPIESPRLVLDLFRPAGPYSKGPQEVSLPPYERYVDDMAALAAAVRGDKPLHVSFDEDIIVQEALIAASGM
ncbi:MAG: Gfo/Idh/MocA family oxidoreductase [Bryobacterales bacterium]|nr:Gfo/Idh/MocA family oxidoreductase [Bryobacterales bacterium]